MKILLTTVVALAFAPFSKGAVVTYSFTGVIGAVEMNDNGILGAINTGDTVSGSFSFDPLVANGGSAADRVLKFMIGSRDISMSTTLNFVRTQNNVSLFGLGVVDRFRYGFDSNGPTTSLDPLYLYQLDIEFIDTSASVYDGSQTLDVDLNLTDYDEVRFFMRGADIDTRTDDFRVSGTLTSVSVPEPSLIVLLLAAPFTLLHGGVFLSVKLLKSQQAG
jgi:hypothetical protein